MIPTAKYALFNNLAYTHYLMKEYPAALEESLASLRLTQRLEANIQALMSIALLLKY